MKLRGHHPKVDEAYAALEREGKLLANLRPVHRDRRIIDWLKANGYGEDLPTRSSIARYFAKANAT